MKNTLKAFKEAFADLVQLCIEIPSVTLQDAVLSIHEQVSELEDDNDMDVASSLLSELMVHVNDLDQEEAEEYQVTLEDINEMLDELTDEFFY